jgi:hypothetical protein
VLLWWATAALCLFTGVRAEKPRGSFLLGAAALSAMLCMDDLFMLHEKVFRVGLGIPQKLTYATYLTFTAIHLFRFRNYILSGDWGPLVLALGLLGSSVLSDVVSIYLPTEPRGASFLEDAAKFVGISVWLGYFWNECRRALASGSG